MAGTWTLTAALVLAPAIASGQSAGWELFTDDFEQGAAAWRFPVTDGHELVAAGEVHGTALSLQTRNGIVVALIDGSERWRDVRVEGEVLFPSDEQNYLGFVYRYVDHDGRIDFGSLYIKGNGSYIRANPHRDLNVGRTLYEEFRTPLVGEAAIQIGEWQRFALEVVGSEAHVYVGDMTRPQVTFPYWKGETGAFGFKARNPGGPVWIDDIRARAIDGFTYRGPPLPALDNPDPPLLLRWEVLGPLTRFVPEVEAGYDPDARIDDAGASIHWMPYEPDARGAVVTADVTHQRDARRVAYFHASVELPADTKVALDLSTVDDLALWLNGRFVGFAARDDAAWWDAWRNEEHDSVTGRLDLVAGTNHLIARVVGGTYASGGFFLRLLPEGH